MVNPIRYSCCLLRIVKLIQHALLNFRKQDLDTIHNIIISFVKELLKLLLQLNRLCVIHYYTVSLST